MVTVVMMKMMMMMVRTNKYICKKLFQAWLAALSPNFTLIKMMMTLMLNMMTQLTNKQTNKNICKKNSQAWLAAISPIHYSDENAVY